MKKISYKIGQTVGFGIACLMFFTILFLILSLVSRKIDFTLNNYLLILIFPAILILSYIIYRIFKK